MYAAPQPFEANQAGQPNLTIQVAAPRPNCNVIRPASQFAGRTIGVKDNIYPDRILQLWYQKRLGRVELTGLQTQIRLDFDRPRQALLPNNGPL